MFEMPTATHLEPESGEADMTTLQNDITHCVALMQQFTTPETLTIGRDQL
jgi:hypothetical protein